MLPVAFLVLSFLRLEATLHIDVRSFEEVLSGGLCQLPEENNVVPLRSFLLLTVSGTSRTDFRMRFGSSKAEGTNGVSILWVIFPPK
jgi:hypothetical protein